MFSPNELLHFVFADRNDLYYCNELLALDLEQYLWLKLHEQGYGCVYYLKLEGDAVSIRTYGDRLARGYSPEKGKRWIFSKQKVRNNGLRKWILRALEEKDPERSAIICDLREFCDYFEGDDWTEFLSELAGFSRNNGILILTASPEAEASRPLLLNSPVFERLKESSVTELRDASPCDMYAALHRSKPEGMVYLNVYTRERVHSLLTRMLLEDSKRTVDCDLLPDIEDFLLQWMNNPELRRLEPQMEKHMPQPDSRFRGVYEKLRREECWNQLTAKAGQIAKAGGIQRYVESLGCALAEDPVGAVCVSRDSDSYAGRCLRLKLRPTGCGPEEREEIIRLQEEIRSQVRAPRNREENPNLVEAVNSLLPELHAADLIGDVGTLRRILFSIKFCIQWICVPEQSEEEAAILTVLEKLQGYIECSRLYHDRQRSFSLIRADQASGRNKLTAKAMRQLEDQAEAARRMLSTYEDVVQAAVVEISVSSASSISSLVNRLSEALSQQNEATVSKLEKDWTPESAEDEALPEPEPEPEEYILNQNDFDLMPNR